MRAEEPATVKSAALSSVKPLIHMQLEDTDEGEGLLSSSLSLEPLN